MSQEPEIPQRRIDLAATKKETVLAYFSNAYNEYDIDSRENSITESYDFIINTGIARIFIKIGRKRWDQSDNISIVEFIKSKEQQICKALFINQNAILPIK